jgi:glycosyl transferase family 87
LRGSLNTDNLGSLFGHAKAWVDRFWAQLLLTVSILIFLATVLFPSSNRITHGFAAYYTASRLALRQRGGPIFYDDKAFEAEVESISKGQASDIYWANPPTTALMMMPLAAFSIDSARSLWTGISLIFLFLAITLFGFVIFRQPFQTKGFYVATSILLLSAPVAENFRYGQAYIMILALYSVALFALSRDLDWLAGLCLGAVLALKASGLPLLVLFLLKGRWRPVAWALITFAGLALFSIALVGIDTWRVYLFEIIPRFLADPVISVTAYQTIPGFVRHLFTYHEIWNPSPLANWPAFAKPFSLLITFMLVGVAGLYSRRAALKWTFCVGLLLSVILVPAAEQHHFILLFPAFLLAAHSPLVSRSPLYVAAGLISVPWMYTTKECSTGWWALTAYPRLYGALILFMILHLHEKNSRLGCNEAANVDAFSGTQ